MSWRNVVLDWLRLVVLSVALGGMVLCGVAASVAVGGMTYLLMAGKGVAMMAGLGVLIGSMAGSIYFMLRLAGWMLGEDPKED